ncbi:hypothetical protein PGT21_019656 [Puccinia graminis f. sp. tritici]|uniref:Cyanovirin-N domain-containing protein n=1 Tax=Puccinia graminis f. sp. tritici TaxID=56615 RepID=A0A5B0R8V1_PUCGR|nr:hypothetical protein PGT21_019656 [Puccinia graminis f. sp. tritici]KAA1121738.1 hypothetical protein PGTUg99_023616 [Puccinia graminis f. sp. tritici]
MLFKKGMCILAAPTLIWGQAVQIHPGQQPIYCEHPERQPVQGNMPCLTVYNCSGGVRHVCLFERLGRAQVYMACGHVADRHYLVECQYGDHINLLCDLHP